MRGPPCQRGFQSIRGGPKNGSSTFPAVRALCLTQAAQLEVGDVLRRPSGLSELEREGPLAPRLAPRCLLHLALAIVHDLRLNAALCILQDPACMSYSQALLHFKGFHAIEVRQGPASLQRTAGSAWRPAAKSCSGPPLLCPGRVSPRIALRLRAGSAPALPPEPLLGPCCCPAPANRPIALRTSCGRVAARSWRARCRAACPR